MHTLASFLKKIRQKGRASRAILLITFTLLVLWLLIAAIGLLGLEFAGSLRVFASKLTIGCTLVVMFLVVPSKAKLLAGSILATILLLELALQGYEAWLCFRYPKTNVEHALWRYDSLLGWKKASNHDMIFSSRENRFRARVQTNSLGLRDDEYAYEKPANGLRILLIGNSATAGLEVNKPDVIDTQMEQILREKTDYSACEVINAGTRGYGSDQCLLFLQTEGRKYRPDVVIYIFSFNDVSDNLNVYRAGKKFGKGFFTLSDNDSLILKGVPVPQDFDEKTDIVVNHLGKTDTIAFTPRIQVSRWKSDPHSLFDSVKKDLAASQLYQFLRFYLRRNAMLGPILVKAGLLKPDPYTPPPPEGHKDHRTGSYDLEGNYRLRLFRRILQGMNLASDSIGAKFAVYEFWNGINRPPRFTTEADTICQIIGAGYIESYDAFYRISKGKKTFCYPFDGHWNEAGHQLAAEGIVDFLVQNRWIRPR